MKLEISVFGLLCALQASAFALDINQLPLLGKTGDRCRAELAPNGYVTAGGQNAVVCKASGYVGSTCYCYAGQYRVQGHIIRSSDYADVQSGNRCRVDMAAYGMVTANGKRYLMCLGSGWVGTTCACSAGQNRVVGQIVRSSDYADVP